MVHVFRSTSSPFAAPGLILLLAVLGAAGSSRVLAAPWQEEASSTDGRRGVSQLGSRLPDGVRAALDGRSVTTGGAAAALGAAPPEPAAAADAASLSPGSGAVILILFLGLITALLFQWSGDRETKKGTAPPPSPV